VPRYRQLSILSGHPRWREVRAPGVGPAQAASMLGAAPDTAARNTSGRRITAMAASPRSPSPGLLRLRSTRAMLFKALGDPHVDVMGDFGAAVAPEQHRAPDSISPTSAGFDGVSELPQPRHAHAELACPVSRRLAGPARRARRTRLGVLQKSTQIAAAAEPVLRHSRGICRWDCRRRSGSPAPSCPAASNGGWRWPVPCWPTGQWSCSMSPTTGLDPATESRLIDDLLAVTRGKTLVMVAHQPRLTDRADQVVRVDGGRITLAGPPTADRQPRAVPA